MTRATSEIARAERELHYEGFPLEAVLARVHAAHGVDVTITAADRVRRGGIGGFFAREVFQVTVTVPAPDPSIAPRPISIFGSDYLERQVERASSPGAGSDEGFDPDDIDPEDIEGALGLVDPVERDDADAEIWALLAAAATADAPAPTTPAPEWAPEPAHEPAPEIVAPIVSTGPIASTVLIPTVNAPVPPPVPLPAGTLPVSPLPVSPLPVSTVFPSSDEVWPTAAERAVAAEEQARVDLGELLDRFERVPQAPSLPVAGIIAVLGTRAEALDIAGRLAAELGIPTEDVIVAAPAVDVVVPTPEDAMRLAATARFRCNPLAVVVVELVPGRQGHEWARVVLDGLRPEQVRLAADAGRLLSHQHLGIAAVGGVDVIDLLGAAEHPSPADVLDLSTPVGTIDGRPASPELWAAMVLAARVGRSATIDRSMAGAR